MATSVGGTLDRRWLFRNIGWIAAAALVALLALLPAAQSVFGSAPPEHKVTICHATPPDTAANGWVTLEVDVASVGYQHAGHESEHDADIIPPYAYGEFTFDGKNWDAAGQATWGNDCVAVEATVAPTETATATATATATPTEDGEVLPTEGTNPTGEVKPATGEPNVTLPPTDATVASRDASAPIGLIVGIAALISLVALTIARRPAGRTG